MKTVVKMFKPEFSELVRTGKKRQTIRPTPKRMPKVGDMVSLRCWADKPYRSKHVILGDGRIRNVYPIRIYADHEEEPIQWEMWIGDRFLTIREADSVARADGFPGVCEMLEWFEREHGLPFEGILIRWELSANAEGRDGAKRSSLP